MKWRRSRRSSNVEDRRGRSRGKTLIGGGLGGLVIVVAALFLGVDPALLTGLLPDVQRNTSPPVEQTPQMAEEREFVSAVLGDTEDVWHQLFQQQNSNYQEPKLVLFSGSVRSACGMASSAVGPFYCPGDKQVYLDTSFFDDLSRRFGAPGDFAQAYVIAHEVGHHVQTITGISSQVRARQNMADKAEANRLSVRQELQADCFAGIWAHHAQSQRDILESGDIEEGLAAAAAIGDDRLQRQAQGYVVPESFTHGTSAQRVEWFTRGWRSGRLADCDTFANNI